MKTVKKKDLFFLILLGIVGFFGQYYITKAFQNRMAHKIAPFKYIEVVFTIFFSVFILDEKYTILNIIGIFMVIGGLVLNLLYKSTKKKLIPRTSDI